MASGKNLSEFLQYLVDNRGGKPECSRLPSLKALSKEVGVSTSSLREQMEVARAMGLVEARPRTGLRCLPYSFLPAVRQSLTYAIALDDAYFNQFAELRRNIEACFWHQAVILLTPQDKQVLKDLTARAWEKLRGTPIQIPHSEHRLLHLTIYRQLDNPFVLGLLEAYWEAYEAVGLNLYTDYDYLKEVWDYHQRMVDAIWSGDFEGGYRALVEHADLIYHMAIPIVVKEL